MVDPTTMSLTVSISQTVGKTVLATTDTKKSGSSGDLRGFLSQSRHKLKPEDLRSRLEKHKAERMGVEEEPPPRMRSRWDDEGEEERDTRHHQKHHGDSSSSNSKVAVDKHLNKENAAKYKKEVASDEKIKKSTVNGRNKSAETEQGEAKKKKKKRHASRSPAGEEKKKTSRPSRSRSRGRKHSRSPTKRRRPLTEKLSEKLSTAKRASSWDRRDRRREESPRGRDRGDRKRKHSPDRPRGSSPSASRREKERKRSSAARSRSKSAGGGAVKDKSKEKKEKKHKRSDSKEKEVKKKKKKNKEKRDKSEHKEKKDKEGKKDKKSTPKKTKTDEEETTVEKRSEPTGGQEESETERKRRKSRVDSGISTGSGHGAARDQQQKQAESTGTGTIEEEEKNQRLCSKVSDSPLSGPSLSPTPPRSPEPEAVNEVWTDKDRASGSAPVIKSIVRMYSESPSPLRRQEADSTGLEGLMQWGRGENKAETEEDGQRIDSKADDGRAPEEARKAVEESEMNGVKLITDERMAASVEKGRDDVGLENGYTIVNSHDDSLSLSKEDQNADRDESTGKDIEERRLTDQSRDRRRERGPYEREDHYHRSHQRHRRYPEEGSSKEGGRGDRYRGDRIAEVSERPRDRRRNRSLERRERSRDRTSRNRRRDRTPEPLPQRRDERSAERRSRSIERRDWDRRDYGDRGRDIGGGSRRFSDEEYRSRRGDRYSQHRDYQRRYSCEYSRQITSTLADPTVTAGLDWTEKVQMFLESTRTSTLVELPRETSALAGSTSGGGSNSSIMPSFDPSKPPPLLMAANPVPDYAAVAAYSDPTVPNLDGTTSSLVTPDIAAMYTPYPQPLAASRAPPAPLMGLVLPPPASASLRQSLSPPQEVAQTYRHEPVISTVMHSVEPSPPVYHQPEIHTAVSVDSEQEQQQRASREREMKPLTAKEKKRLDMLQKEVWQYVGRKIFNDKIFLSRRKKKGGTFSPEEDKEELKKAEKCAVRLALRLEKAGYSETRLWHLLKDNQKGIQGFYDEMKTAVISGAIEVDRDTKKPKEKLEADLLLDGTVFKYIGEYIQANPFQMNKTRRLSSADSAAGGAAVLQPQLEEDRLMQQQQVLPSTNDLQSILYYAKSLPTAAAATTATATTTTTTTRPDHLVPQEGESAHLFALRSLADLRSYMTVQLVRTLKMEVAAATDMAAHYAETLATAGFNYITLRDTIANYRPPEPEFEGEPVQSVYGHLLECLRDLAFEKYPKALSESSLDTHLTNIVRIALDYYSRERRSQTRTPSPTPRPSVRTVGEEEPGFIGPMPPCETVPVGGNTVNQLPQRRYVLVAVSVDTVPVEGRLVVWQISVHIPSLPDNEDPDYECLMLPTALREGRPDLMADLGFIYDTERAMFYHEGTEYGRRRAEPEEVSLEKFTNYLDEIRSGLRGAGPNNGLVLLFETGEDLALMQQLLSRHRHDIFLDVVKGVACLDHYLRMSRPAGGRSTAAAAYSWPSYHYRVGGGGRWTASLAVAGSAAKRIEAETKPECIYNICESLLGAPPGFNNFVKWYTFPLQHTETSRMTASLEHILELLPLQNHIDRQLFTNRVQVVLEGVYAARSEVEAARPHNACARQTIRRLVALGFTLDVLKKSFGADPNYEIPSSVFLQDMTEVQKLRVHGQTDLIRSYIKQYFVRAA